MSRDISKTYFELFDLPPAYGVDRERLDQRYRELQRSVHPDRFASAPDQQRRQSMQLATRLNEAYAVLKDPLARGRYLLELRGHVFDDERNTTRDPAFLMEQMALREALGEVTEQADPLAALGAIMDRISERFRSLSAELEVQLSGGDSELAPAVDTVLKMKFYRRLQEEAAELEADIEDNF